jgi:pilus assembly protein TadC
MSRSSSKLSRPSRVSRTKHSPKSSPRVQISGQLFQKRSKSSNNSKTRAVTESSVESDLSYIESQLHSVPQTRLVANSASSSSATAVQTPPAVAQTDDVPLAAPAPPRVEVNHKHVLHSVKSALSTVSSHISHNISNHISRVRSHTDKSSQKVESQSTPAKSPASTVENSVSASTQIKFKESDESSLADLPRVVSSELSSSVHDANSSTPSGKHSSPTSSQKSTKDLNPIHTLIPFVERQLKRANNSALAQSVLFKLGIGSLALWLIASIYWAVHNQLSFTGFILTLGASVLWVVPLSFFILLFLFTVYVDTTVISQKEQIEKFLPDLYHNMASNMRAGMTIEQALLSASKPQFGLLAIELEYVAKKAFVGDDISVALTQFAQKYDSKILKRSVLLIIEGLNAGSEMSDLLENLALSIEEMESRRASMAANVTQYSIFIMVSVLVAAPMLFAVANQLLSIIHVVASKLTSQNVSGVGGISLSLTGEAVSSSDFFLFTCLMLFCSVTMSTIIISAIKKGNYTSGLKDLPLYWIVTLGLFIGSHAILQALFGGVFI